MKLTWKDIVKAHREVRKGLYKSEREIFEREATLLNRILQRKKAA